MMPLFLKKDKIPFSSFIPHRVRETPGAEAMIEKAAAEALDAVLVKAGDLVAIAARHPEYMVSATHMIQVKQV